MEKRKLIIIGSGPAGLTAAIYASRADLRPLVIAGSSAGGQLMLTTEVENFPGFSEGILGPQLMQAMRKQAERFNAEFVDAEVLKVDFKVRPFIITAQETTYETDAVIIATGAQVRWLGLHNEQRLIGKGVSSCAVCDAFFYKNKKVIVVGGGDSAMEEALVLAKFAQEVSVVHRRDSLKASKIMQDRAKANPKINFIWSSAVEDILGEDRVTGVKLKDLNTGETARMEIDGVFMAIGYTPATAVFKDQIELDNAGYIQAYNETHTNIEGVFVAGDVEDYRYRQAITAAGAGCKAALDAEKYLTDFPN